MKAATKRDDLVGAAAAQLPHLRTNLMAPLLASAPLLVKKAWSSLLVAVNRFANSIMGALKNARLQLIKRVACRMSAVTTAGGECPKQFTAHL